VVLSLSTAFHDMVNNNNNNNNNDDDDDNNNNNLTAIGL
jgi:hypothetical protein